MKIYIAIIEDRHVEPEATPFKKKEKAIEYLKGIPGLEEHSLNTTMKNRHWVFYATYGGENSVRVVENTLR